jgi:hypothetical protein
MKILAISDIDDLDWKHGGDEADVLLSCGDISDQVILEAAEAYACADPQGCSHRETQSDRSHRPLITFPLRLEGRPPPLCSAHLFESRSALNRAAPSSSDRQDNYVGTNNYVGTIVAPCVGQDSPLL